MDPLQSSTTSGTTATIAQIASLIKPKVHLILSGKRKCGKDFLEQIMLERFPEAILSYRISAPIKGAFARQNGLDFAELLTASQYKEQYRQQMVVWSEAIRASDPHFFLRLAIAEAAAKTDPKPIWLLNDARRPTDLHYFADSSEIDMSATQVIKLRIVSSEATRFSRGWVFTPGIDDQTTECGLDAHSEWDYIIHNDSTKEDLLCALEPVFKRISELID